MGVTSRMPPLAKTNGQAKKASNGRSNDRTVVSRAAALMAEKPVLRPAMALRRAGVKSPAAVKRLSKLLKDREREGASRLEKKTKAAAATRSEPKSRHAIPADSQTSAGKGHAKQARSSALEHSRGQEDFSPEATSAPPGEDAARLPVAQALMELPYENNGGAPMGADLLTTMSGIQMQFWSAMFQWSPLGVLLSQTTAAARLIRRPDRHDRPTS